MFGSSAPPSAIGRLPPVSFSASNCVIRWVGSLSGSVNMSTCLRSGGLLERCACRPRIHHGCVAASLLLLPVCCVVASAVWLVRGGVVSPPVVACGACSGGPSCPGTCRGRDCVVVCGVAWGCSESSGLSCACGGAAGCVESVVAGSVVRSCASACSAVVVCSCVWDS